MKNWKIMLGGFFIGLFLGLSCFINYASASWNNQNFLDSTFWDSNPDDQEIISALYWADSIYTSNWTWYDINPCETQDMHVEYASALPSTLDENTIYVLSSDLEITSQINFSKCSAIVWNWNIEITTTDNWWLIFYINTAFSIIDNLSISDWIKHCWVYWENTNSITINNLYINNLSAWLAFVSINYSYLNNIIISNNIWNNNSALDLVWDWLIIIDWDYNIIKNIDSYNNYYWVQLNGWSDYNYLEGLQLHNNNIYWLGVYANNKYNVINNVISYNNKQNGIWIYNGSNYNSFNNLQLFHNWENDTYAWILIDKSDYNIFNNWLVYNNTKWVWNNSGTPWNNNIFIDLSVYNNGVFWTSISSHGNKYYWILKSFANWWDNEFTVLEKWDETWVLPEWQLVSWDLSRDIVTNPTDGINYLFDWSNDLWWKWWVDESFKNKIVAYSYWSLIPTNSELYVWSDDEIIITWASNDNFVGSNTEKVWWKFLTNWINIVWITDSDSISKRIYLNEPWISGDINVYQWLESSQPENMLWQFVLKWWNYIHATVEEDKIAPECEVQYDITWATTSSVTASLINCSEDIFWTELSYPFTTNWTHNFVFYDIVWNEKTVSAEVSWISNKTTSSWGHSRKSKVVKTGDDIKDEKNEISFNEETFNKKYSDEFNMWYQRSYENWIISGQSIEDCEMDKPMTRIAMAEMLSKYAINVLWKTPDTKRIIKFDDVSSELDSEYGDWVTLAYQLWIMWINILDGKFRPFDYVTRAEFGATLSRLLFRLDDWKYFYYSPHLRKLLKEWIIPSRDPDLKELRWNIMFMLMKTHLLVSKVENINGLK